MEAVPRIRGSKQEKTAPFKGVRDLKWFAGGGVGRAKGMNRYGRIRLIGRAMEDF